LSSGSRDGSRSVSGSGSSSSYVSLAQFGEEGTR
jgi:hypothetical protein